MSVIEFRPTVGSVTRELGGVSGLAEWLVEVCAGEGGLPFVVAKHRHYGTEYAMHWAPTGWAAFNSELALIARATKLGDVLTFAPKAA